MSSILSSFIQWVSIHPHLTGLIVGVIACSEALAFVGLVVPGSVLMLAAGILVGTGLVNFWSIFAWAVGGAVLGDGISYWIGHHYRQKLHDIHILRRHPQWLLRGTSFFERHGGKSIILARFIGPVRPVIPVVAGMFGMSPLRFYLNNVFSALAWALTHLLAGMVVGVSLVIAGQVATRLAIFLTAMLISTWLIVWLVHVSYRQIQPRVIDWVRQISASKWIIAHPKLRWLLTDLYDPERPAVRALLIWLSLLIASMWLFLGVLEDVLHQDPLVYAGQAVFHFLQHIRTPLGDAIMIGITELGDAAVTLPLAIAVLLFLLWRHRWRDSLYWLGTLGFGLLAVTVIKLMLKIPRPVSLYSGTELYSFPSGHATMSTVIYGLLAVYVAPTLNTRWRWFVYAIAVLLITTIAFSRLYLGAHWLADVTAGLALGTAGIALIAIARDRHQPTATAKSSSGLLIVSLGVFVMVGSWHITKHFDVDLKRYAIRHPVTLVSETEWLTHRCGVLPIWRIDLGGEQEQPLNVQWAGDIKTIQQELLSRGWHEPTKLTMRTALSWFLPHPSLSQLPVLPRLHDGQSESLVLIRQGYGKNHKTEQLILRLWPTALRLKKSELPIWNGTVASQQLKKLPLISIARLSNDYNQAQEALKINLAKQELYLSRCQIHNKEKEANWNGDVLAITTSR